MIDYAPLLQYGGIPLVFALVVTWMITTMRADASVLGIRSYGWGTRVVSVVVATAAGGLLLWAQNAFVSPSGWWAMLAFFIAVVLVLPIEAVACWFCCVVKDEYFS